MIDQIRIHEYSNFPIPHLNIDNYEFDKRIYGQISKEIMLKFRFIPIDIYGSLMTVVVSFPCIELLSDLEKLTGKTVRVFWADDKQIISKIMELKSRRLIEQEPEVNWKG